MLLQRAGYETAFIGKWHMGNDDSRRPGFDTWVSFKGQGQYLDPEISEDGRTATVRGYITDILNARAVEFLRRPRSNPFLLYLSHKAVHPNIRQLDDGSTVPIDGEMFVPAERHRQLLIGATVPRRPNFGMPPLDKPALMRTIGDLPPLGLATVTDDATVLGRERALAAVDDGVGAILKALEEQGQLANTVIIFAGDNGYFYGEHGLSEERRLAYEESARIPLVARFPNVIPAGSTPSQLVLNLDIAPTVLELAGVARPAGMEGRSLVSVFSDTMTPWRSSFVIEYFSDTVFPRILSMGYQALRTERWKYIRYTELRDMDELYDLASDPYELRNLIAEPGHSADRDRLNQELDQLLRAP
jgi:N-acetylglucosamine-6-sulfatase